MTMQTMQTMPQNSTLSAELMEILTTEYEAPEGTTADTAYDMLGFDSLVLVELAVALTKQFGVQVTDDELQEAGNIAGTIELLRAKGVPA